MNKIPCNAKLAASIYSIIAPEVIAEFVSTQFNLSKVTECVFWCQGINDTYKLSNDNESYMVRVYRYGWRTKQEIEFEIEALQFIINKSSSTQQYVANVQTVSSTSIAEIDAIEGKRFVVLTRWANGSVINANTSSSTRLYAKSLAVLHEDSNGFKSANQRLLLEPSIMLYSSYQEIKPYLQSKPHYQQWLLDLIGELNLSLEGLVKSPATFGFCHGDYNGLNAHLFNDQITLFDFDCCGNGYRIYDLATFKWFCLTNNMDLKVWKIFLEEYQQHRVLLQAELNVINEFVMVRQIWIIALHCKTALAKGWLNESYFEFQFNLLKQWQNKDFTSKQFIY